VYFAKPKSEMLESNLKFDLFFKDDTWQIIAEVKKVFILRLL